MTDQPGQQSDRGGWRSMWLGGAALLMFFVPPIALFLGVVALIMGFRARRQARQTRVVARGAVAGIVMGSIGCAISAMLLTLQIILWTELSNLNTCKAAANTIADEQQCNEMFLRDVEKRLDFPKGSLKRLDLPT